MRFSVGLLMFIFATIPASAQTDVPKVADPRLIVELVAQQPDIVHPVSCDFDHKGRLLVIESTLRRRITKDRSSISTLAAATLQVES